MSDIEIIKGVCARLGEHYDEYLIVVKSKDGKIAFRPSDCTWAMGAAMRFLDYMASAQEVKNADEDDSE